MSKFIWLLLLLVLPAQAQVVTGRPGSPQAKSFIVSSQILHEGSFQLQHSGPGFTNWSSLTNFNMLPGTNVFTHTITNAQQYYRVMRFTSTPRIIDQPSGLTNFHNEEVRLEVGSTGSWPIRYYWFRNAEPIPGATSNVLVFPGRAALSGNYNVVVSNTWGIALSPAVAVKTINPVATTILGKKIQYVIKGQEGGFPSSGTFQTTYSSLSYNTTSPNAAFNDIGDWQYGGLPAAENPNGINDNVGRVVLSNGFVYPDGTRLDMTFTNTTAGTYVLRMPNSSARHFGDFQITN